MLRFGSFIYLCNTFIVHRLTFIHNVNFGFLIFILDVIAPPPIAIKGVHWVMDGPKFAYNVDGCDASYMAK